MPLPTAHRVPLQLPAPLPPRRPQVLLLLPLPTLPVVPLVKLSHIVVVPLRSLPPLPPAPPTANEAAQPIPAARRPLVQTQWRVCLAAQHPKPSHHRHHQPHQQLLP